MRGDSRIDLYAKSLAVIGLGLVAAIGAAIDYWPGDIRLPRVAAGRAHSLTPAVRINVAMRGIETDPNVVPAVVRAVYSKRATTPTTPASSVAVSLPRPEVPPAPVRNQLPTFVVRTGLIALSLPPAQLVGQPETTIAEAVSVGVDRPAALPPPILADQPSDGFFSGMLKKTGSSVGNSLGSVSTSLGKASTSLVGAVRVVGDMVKKAF